METKDLKPKRHIGRNICRLREIRGMKQETLAEILGISQQKLSLIENTEELEDQKITEIAKALEVNTETIKSYSDEKVLSIINNTFHDNAFQNGVTNYTPTFNPIDKVAELYERLLKAEQEKVAFLEQLLNKKE
ncbi:helix-turn-helix domain-containing protein [Flavobacterium sp. NKUCC04_CG]|uniref:helix-turn-helix domain-containing protein n=1 Tax=Flavobacterium sp. NKUCC04_CG TaxID=2842121 RepID=UPI001C5BAD3B|nr:helix-turn-helix transcriptional regulator [Flavobacterium sp. NKUCC04_CG]MBW3517554.1 helix-turn-helix domain-containing protein [Flavobacterium sp. NKUCC04_CG]